MKTSTLRFAFASVAMGASLLAFGQEQSKIVSFSVTPDGETNLSFNLGSSLAEGQTVQVDWGDGTLVSETVTLNERTTTKPTTNFYAIPKGATVTVYGDASTINELDASWATGKLKIQGTDISALTKASWICFDSNSLTSLDASACDSVATLQANNNALTSIKLGSATNLKSLELSNSSATNGSNRISEFVCGTLPALTTLKMNYNYTESIDFTKMPAIVNVYAIYCSFSTVDFSQSPKIAYVNVNYNNLSELDLSMSSNVQVFATKNKLTSILIPQGNTKNIAVAENRLTFATLPYTTGTLTCNSQAAMDVTPEGNTIDLSSQLYYQGTATKFVWANGQSNTLVEGTDYSVTDGVFTFNNNFTGLVCTMTNSHTKVKNKITLTTNPVDINATAIDAIKAEAEGAAEYYNLQGIRVSNPENGIFIKRQGGKSVKVVR